MNHSRTGPRSEITQKTLHIGVAILVTMAAWMWALYVRQLLGRAPLSLYDLIPGEVNAYGLAVSIESLVAPLVLIYLLSGTPPFRRIVSGESRSRDELKLSGMLVLIQFLALSYDLLLLALAPDRTTFGLLLVIVGGLFGGWRLGLGLGLISALTSGTYIYLLDTGGTTLLHLLRLRAPEDTSAWMLWQEAFNLLGNEFAIFYVANLRASMAIWGGIIAGVCAGLLKDRWLSPAVAFGLGAAIELGSGYVIALSVERPTEFIGLLIASAPMSGLALAAVALIVRGVQADVARRKAERAELALARAELRALRAQIKPHFLFNALNTIRYFVRNDPETARRLLMDLSEVFQRAIRSGEVVPLRDELSCTQAYLSLEKARLGERLQVAWAGEVTQPQLLHETESPVLEQPVPTLSVQPIVENAVIHGISKKPEGGTVRITIEKTSGELLIQVEDDGMGIEPTRLADILKPAAASDSSIGLRNVDGRLRALYGEGHGLVVESAGGHGTRVKIKIPIKRVADGK